MAVYEKLHVDAWLINRLEADATLAGLISGVYSERIPSNRSLPAVRLQLMAAPDVMGVGTHRIMTRYRYLVAGIVDGPSPGPLEPVLNRVDELLQGASGESATVVVMGVTRTESISYSEKTDGVDYWHVGGIYTLHVNQK